MKLRGYLSALVLSAYLLAVGGSSLSVILCPCLALAHQRTHVCLACDRTAADCAQEGAHPHFGTRDCCGHDHEGRPALYTCNDHQRTPLRPAVIVGLIQAFVPQTDPDIYIAARPYLAAVHPVKPYDDPTLSSAGLRDPPVRA